MRSRSALCFLLLPLLAGFVPQAAVASSAVAQTRTLFRWKIPAKGNTGAWTFSKGTIAYGGQSNSSVFPRFTLKHVANFAVQATMRGIGPGGPQANLIGFGLTVRQAPTDPHTSISGGSFVSSQDEDNNPELYWNGDTVGGAAFNPGTAWHTYRLEVHDNQYTLSIDGNAMVQYPIDAYPFPTRVGIFSAYYRVEVKDFTVLRLGSTGATTASAPALKPFNLALSDLPQNTYFQPQLRHYTTNAEAARERGVSMESIEASGRITSYNVSFLSWGTDLFDLYSAITAYRSPESARADIATRLSAFQKQYAGFSGFRLLQDQHVGDSNMGLRFDFNVDGQNFTLIVLLFSRGPYSVLLRTVFVTDSLTETEKMGRVVDLAKAVDGRAVGR